MRLDISSCMVQGMNKYMFRYEITRPCLDIRGPCVRFKKVMVGHVCVLPWCPDEDEDADATEEEGGGSKAGKGKKSKGKKAVAPLKIKITKKRKKKKASSVSRFTLLQCMSVGCVW